MNIAQLLLGGGAVSKDLGLRGVGASGKILDLGFWGAEFGFEGFSG